MISDVTQATHPHVYLNILDDCEVFARDDADKSMLVFVCFGRVHHGCNNIAKSVTIKITDADYAVAQKFIGRLCINGCDGRFGFSGEDADFPESGALLSDSPQPRGTPAAQSNKLTISLSS